MAIASLTRALQPSVKGSVNYQNRKVLDDVAENDDWIAIEFSAKSALAEDLLDSLPTLISAFSAYLLELGGVELLSADFDRWRKWARTHDERRDVFRIFPVAYYSADLCKSAFRMTPKKVCTRLANHVASCQEISGGVYVVGSRGLMSISKANSYDRRIRALLASKKSG
jgi:hypothetical protein